MVYKVQAQVLIDRNIQYTIESENQAKNLYVLVEILSFHYAFRILPLEVPTTSRSFAVCCSYLMQLREISILLDRKKHSCTRVHV